jgi:4,5-DOPA dioxygenase extradiol
MSRPPVLFISHGAPTYALEPGVAGARLGALGAALPRPRAVLIVSPHWTTREVQVGASLRPETIHDFGGFSPALYDIEYPVPSDFALAARTRDQLKAAGWPASLDERRGLDHGAWVPMRHLYPAADVPTFQVSMPASLDAAAAYRLGAALAPLRDEGILIIGSGSLTHNLYEFRSSDGAVPDYARQFVTWIRAAVVAGDHERLVQAMAIAPHARHAHPTPEHYLPLLVAAGASGGDTATVLDGGFTHGVLSMQSYVFGAPVAAAAPLNLEETLHG